VFVSFFVFLVVCLIGWLVSFAVVFLLFSFFFGGAIKLSLGYLSSFDFRCLGTYD